MDDVDDVSLTWSGTFVTWRTPFRSFLLVTDAQCDCVFFTFCVRQKPARDSTSRRIYEPQDVYMISWFCLENSCGMLWIRLIRPVNGSLRNNHTFWWAPACVFSSPCCVQVNGKLVRTLEDAFDGVTRDSHHTRSPQKVIICHQNGTFPIKQPGDWSDPRTIRSWLARNFPVAPNPLLQCKEWREALVPSSGSVWTLETDLGILLASPFKAATTHGNLGVRLLWVLSYIRSCSGSQTCNLQTTPKSW